MRAIVLLAGILGLVGVVAKAYEAHGLLPLPDISEPRLRDFTTAAEMMLFHALALLGVAGVAVYLPRASLAAAFAFFAGSVLFAAPLLLFALTSDRSLIFAAPIGGGLLMIGWAALIIGGALALTRKDKP